MTTRTQEDMTVVHTAPREWANATPAGLVALAVACVGFFAILSGRVDASAMPLLGCWLLGGFVIQLTVGLTDLKAGNMTGGNTFTFFSAFFMLTSGIEMFFKYNAIQAGSALDGRMDGYVWCVLFVTLWLWTPAFCTKFSLLSLVVILLDVALPFIALVDLGLISKSFSHVAAWAMLCSGLVAVYLCSAMIVNGAFGKNVFPLPGAKK